MGDNSLHSLVYSKEVVEFVTIANDFCELTEKGYKITVKEALCSLRRILPFLYFKAILLPQNEKMLDDDIGKHVTELDYNVLQQRWLKMLGEHDSYYEVFDPDLQFDEEVTTASISESLMDIYQDLKDFTVSYSIGDEVIMNDALHDCVCHFNEFWGQRLVNVLRAVHMLMTGDIDFEHNNEVKNYSRKSDDRSQWFKKYWDNHS